MKRDCIALLALCMIITSLLVMFRPEPQVNVWRTDTCVHFLLEGQEVGPKHEIDGGEALRNEESDVSWEPGESHGFTRYQGPDLERYARVFIETPEGLRVEGMVYFHMENGYYLCDFEMTVRPGWSGSPVFEHKSGHVMGLVSAVRFRYNMWGYPVRYAIVCPIPDTFPEQPVEEAEEEASDESQGEGGHREDQGRGK